MPYTLDETLYEPEEKDGTTVPEGDPRARFLVGVEGQTISDAEAERLGLSGDKPARKAVPPADAATKAVQPEDVANKAQDGPKTPKARGTE